MGDKSKFIKIMQVHSDIAGHKRGASLGVDALVKFCEDSGSDYFNKYPVEVILHENNNSNDTTYKRAKHIDKIYKVIERIAYRIKDIREENLFPIILAGDHASCAGTMHGLKMAHPNDEIGVVYIDAHADIHSPYTSDSGNIHGMPLAAVTAIDNMESKKYEITEEEKKYWEKMKYLSGNKPAVKPENIIFCALRDYQKAEDDLIKRHNIKKFTAEEITYLGIKAIIEDIFQRLKNCQHIYVSFDVDSIDPLYLPGTGTPSEDGLSFEQALQLNMELIKNEKVCCWEIAEINPKFDENERGTKAISKILEIVTKMLIKYY